MSLLGEKPNKNLIYVLSASLTSRFSSRVLNLLSLIYSQVEQLCSGLVTLFYILIIRRSIEKTSVVFWTFFFWFSCRRLRNIKYLCFKFSPQTQDPRVSHHQWFFSIMGKICKSSFKNIKIEMKYHDMKYAAGLSRSFYCIRLLRRSPASSAAL